MTYTKLHTISYKRLLWLLNLEINKHWKNTLEELNSLQQEDYLNNEHTEQICIELSSNEPDKIGLEITKFQIYTTSTIFFGDHIAYGDHLFEVPRHPENHEEFSILKENKNGN